MDTPKTQKELLQIIVEQDKQIRSLKQAMMRLEKKVQGIAMVTESNRGQTRRLNENANILADHIRTIQRKLS